MKLLKDSELTAIHQMTQLGGSIPSHIVLDLLGHIEALKTEAAVKIWLSQERMRRHAKRTSKKTIS